MSGRRRRRQVRIFKFSRSNTLQSCFERLHASKPLRRGENKRRGWTSNFPHNPFFAKRRRRGEVFNQFHRLLSNTFQFGRNSVLFLFPRKGSGCRRRRSLPPMMDRPDKWLRRTNFSSLQSRQKKANDMPRIPITREKNEYFFPCLTSLRRRRQQSPYKIHKRHFLKNLLLTILREVRAFFLKKCIAKQGIFARVNKSFFQENLNSKHPLPPARPWKNNPRLSTYFFQKNI